MREPILLVWGRGTGVGGTETRMAEVVAHLRSSGSPAVSVMLRSDTASPLARLLEHSGSAVVAAPAAREVAALVRGLRPRLIVAFGLRASLVVRALRLGRRSWPTTVDARNGLEARRCRVAWLLDRLTQGLVDIYLANSDAAAANLMEHGIDGRRVRTLYSALGEAWQDHHEAKARTAGSIVMIGNARPEKRQEVGLEVFARLPVAATLTVFTDDATALRHRWQELAAKARGDVQFREGHSVAPADLERAAVVLHPSSHESAPRCLMEARASGCYVVAFDVGDTRRIVGDGGVLVPSGDLDALLSTLR